MAVARLSRVVIEASRGELGTVLALIIKFRMFHPSRREGMIQDVGILLLASRAQAVYAQASDLLGKRQFKTERMGSREVEKFEARTVDELVNALEEYVEIIERDLSLFTEEEDKQGVVDVLLAAKEAASMVFNDLQRILVYPPKDGKIRFEGFVPTKTIKSFRSLIGRYVLSADPVKTQTKENLYIPTLLVNPRIISVFENLTLQRGIPRYGEVDPTPILAFVFPLFFGIMFGDVGHGIALLAFGLYLVYRTPYPAWGKQVLVLSSSATLFGFIRGSFFGLAFASPLQDIIRLPPVFSASFTLSYIPLLLEIAIIVGTFHLASAYAIGFVNQERIGNYIDAFLNRLPTVILYSFIVPFGLAFVGTELNLSVLFTSSAPTPVFDSLLGLTIPISFVARFSLPFIVAMLFFLVAGHPIREYMSSHSFRKAAAALGAGLLDAVAKPFEFFMNTLSYVRLGVLLVTTTLLASLVVDVMSFGILGILTAAFLNVAVISLEGLIVYIQDMRLQLYEWFSQFFVGGGSPFVPMISGGTHFTMKWT